MENSQQGFSGSAKPTSQKAHEIEWFVDVAFGDL